MIGIQGQTFLIPAVANIPARDVPLIVMLIGTLIDEGMQWLTFTATTQALAVTFSPSMPTVAAAAARIARGEARSKAALASWGG